MDDSIGILRQIVKPKEQRETRLKKDHMLKNEQHLNSSRSTLTSSSIYFLHDYCAERCTNDPFASLVLIMMFTSRSYSEILTNLKVQKGGSDCLEELRLYNNWKFAGWNNKDVHPELHDLDSNLYIGLPIYLSSCLRLMNYFTDADVFEKKLRKFIPKNKNLRAESFTLARIRSILEHNKQFIGMSRYDFAFIANQELSKDAHLHYGHVGRKGIQRKFDRFLFAIEKRAIYEQQFEHENIPLETKIGSNFVPESKDISGFFDDLSSQWIKRDDSIQSMLANYNTYTQFVVCYLMLSTLHRPTHNPFKTLINFNLKLGSVCILDKGYDSSRTIPLSKRSIELIKSYLEYRAKLCVSLRFIHPSLADQIQQGCNSKSDLFRLINIKKRKLSDYIPKEVHDKSENGKRLKTNYHRHYIITFLEGIGISRDIGAIYMGHASPSTKDNPFSSVNFNLLHEIAELIDTHISANVNSGGLEINIPRFTF